MAKTSLQDVFVSPLTLFIKVSFMNNARFDTVPFRDPAALAWLGPGFPARHAILFCLAHL